MKINFSHVLGVAVFMSILSGSYVLWNTSSTSDTTEQNTSTLSDRTVSKSDTGIETDTGKRLETFGNSGTNWGMSPFGSGKPLEEEKKPEFKKPNTEWKTRTLSGITYVFGEGNPKEVGLNPEQIEHIGKNCETYESGKNLYDAGFCNPETGKLKYLSPEAENHILAALSDPNWEKLATKCENNFRVIETSDTFQNAIGNPNSLYFERVFTPGFLDIDNFVSVEANTGWKKLNTERTINLSQFIMGAMEYGRIDTKNPYGNCVDIYGKNIVEHLIKATDSYMWPVE